MTEIRRIMAYGKCHEDVTRKGFSEPCGRPAVAVRLDPEDSTPYPVCAYHSRGAMMTLPDLLKAVTPEMTL